MSNKKFDVCIVGMWYGINYGSILTAYALYKTVTDLGYSVIMANKPKQLWNDFFYSENSIAIKFAKKHLVVAPVFDKYDDNKQLNNFSNTFIVGCDTLWHYPLVKTVPTYFFLDFALEGKKKISYASSFGRGFDGPEYIQEKIQHFISRFDAVSSREDDGVSICNDLFNIKATQVIDPVFLVDKKHYSELAKVSKINKSKPYILSYILDPNPDKISAIKLLCKKLGYDSVNIVDAINESKLEKRLTLPIEHNIDVEDWLKLFEQSSFVITDSYHGLCFSLIFNKNFICFGNKARGLSRFKSLLNILSLNYRICFEYNDVFNRLDQLITSIDYKYISNVFDKEVVRCKDWLLHALKIQKKSIDDSVAVQLNRDLCCGCSACSVVCPFHAISMIKDEFGFLRPQVDINLCTDCGLCSKRCTALNPKYKNIAQPRCYAVMANNEIRKISSSGGMFTIVAEHILKEGGYVCGAAYNNLEVEHILVNNFSELYRIRGSKYMQSEVSKIYPKIKKLLIQNNKVLFTGMPCQVSGLYSYLGRDYPGLYTIDLFCHGITSSYIFEKYRQDILGGRKISRLEFKAKEPWGWHAGVNAWFADGTKYSKPLESDPYFKAYLQSMSKNFACGSCNVNRLPRQGDLSMGDFWRCEDFDPKLNDGKGTSAVLVNSQKGEDIFNAIRNNFILSKEVPIDFAIRGNGSIIRPYSLNKNREQFFNHFETMNFSSIQLGCSNNRIYEQVYLDLVKRIPKEEHEFYYIAKFAVEHAKGREIVTWIRSNNFENILKKYFGVKVSFGVSQRKEALVKGRIEDFNILRGKRKQYYLVSLHRAYDDITYKALQQFGYNSEEDFIFRQFKPIVIENLDLSKGNYYDNYGNSIEGFNTIVGKVIFRGFNNHIMLGKNITHGANITVDVGANAFIDIGEGTRFNSASQIEAKDFEYGMSLVIGRNCVFNAGALFRFFNPSSALINESCTSSSHFGLHANQGKKIIIGRDCMFSYENELWAGDGHSVFDVKSGKCTNRDMSGTYSPSNHLVIGDHVWLGKQAFIMHGSNIGSGSIVGARSVVKGVFPNNCAIAGNPAASVKEDVAWSRDGLTSDIRACGRPEYAALTSHAHAPISGRKVLVIGGTRFMGKQLVRELLALGNDVTIATRGKTKDEFGMYVKRLVMDVSNAKTVRAALNGKYFDVIFDNLAYCSIFVNNILSHVSCGKYVQLSSVEAYANMNIDLREEYFNPYRLPVELCNTTAGYIKGKRQAEAIVYQNYKKIHAVTVRIPYVVKTDRLFYYCKNIIKQTPMKIDDVSRGFTFIRDTEVGKFLPWIAAQNFTGPINLASEGMVTIKMILDYVASKTGKHAVINAVNGEESPFHVYNETTFSMNMEKSRQLGYRTSHLNDWFWKLMDEYIHQALKSK